MTSAGDRVGVAIVGYGYWGPNLARNFHRNGAVVRAICDISEDVRSSAELDCPYAEFVTSLDDVLRLDGVDAVCIATPASTHFELSMRCLEANKHCFVEKPIADSVARVSEMISLAEENSRILMTDHTYIYHGGVKKIRELIKSGCVGPVMYYDSVRINLGLFQKDVNVIWDLAVHDFSIMLYLLERRPIAVSASSIRHVQGRPESMAYVTCFFEDQLIAHFHVNWLAPVKVRKTIVGGLDQMIIFDELSADEQVKVYDRGVDSSVLEEDKRDVQVSYRTGDMTAPRFDRTEPLGSAVADFLGAIKEKRKPVSDGYFGRDVIKLLEATELSQKNNGERVVVDWSNVHDR